MRKAQQTRSLVAAWFDFLVPTEQPVALELHRLLRAALPELGEAIRQGNLLLSLNGEPLLAIAPVTGQVELLIFNGAEIEAEFGPLEGVGRRQRLLRCASGEPVDAALVTRIALASAAACRRQQAFGG